MLAWSLGAGIAATAPAMARALPDASAWARGDWLRDARRLGAGTLRVWGFTIYDASLWVEPGFEAARWERHAFALSMRYARGFSGSDIAQRSLDEMQRMQPIAAEVSQRWLAAMQRAFPDVREGDRLTGVWLPATRSGGAASEASIAGARSVFHSTRGSVSIDGDADFGQRFFGLWLSPQGPKQALRAALLGESTTS